MATNIFQRNLNDGQEKKAEALAKFRQATAFAAEMATRELPEIEAALYRVDAYKREVFGDCAESQLPPSIRQLIFQIDQVRGTSGTVQAALASRQQVQVKDLTNHWGPFTTANFNTRLSFARGCAASIERHLARLKLEVDRYRSLHDDTYDAPKNETRRQATI